MVPVGHVVKEGKIGNTTYRICDDCCRGRTQAELDRTLGSLSRIGQRILLHQQESTREASGPR